MTSTYLAQPARSLEDMVEVFDITAMRIREQTRAAIRIFRRGGIPVWTQNYTLDRIRWARQAHSKAIARREEYAAAIRERDIQNALFGGR